MPDVSEPVAPRPPDPPRFPTMSVVAPLVLAGVLVAVFRTPYALMIGVLGPVMGLASWWESKRSVTQRYLAEQEEYEQACLAWRIEKEQDDSAYREQALTATPGVAQWMANPLWRPPLKGVFRIGTHLETRTDGTETRTIAGMPCTVPAGEDIAIVGISPDLSAIARHIRTQLQATDDPDGQEVFVCKTVLDVPTGVRVVIQCGPHHTALCIDGIRRDRGLHPDVLSEAEERWALRRLSRYQPAPLEHIIDPADRGSLWCDLGSGPWNLVDAGPHALVWGRTGRGKTVLLRRLICDLATRYRPDQVGIAVMDFKGGSALVGLRSLPHLIGELSDLDADRLETALCGVQAEMRAREKLLATTACASLTDLPRDISCPRVVLIVDEIAWLVENYPDASAVLSDVAARGRSLGVHLVLCGQRLGGQIPRGILANAGIRMCLGVTDRSEADEYLPGVPPDRVWRLAMKPPGAVLIAQIGSGWHEGTVQPLECPDVTGPSSTALWAPELPEHLRPEPGRVGVIEKPDLQRTEQLGARELERGLMCLVGDHGTGVSSALRRMGEALGERGAPVSLVPDEASQIVDALHAAGSEADSHTWIIPALTSLEQIAGSEAKAMLAELCAKAHSHAQESDSRVVLGVRPGSLLGPLIRRAHAHVWLMRIEDAEVRQLWSERRHAPLIPPLPGRAERAGERVHIAKPLGTPLPPWEVMPCPIDTGALRVDDDNDFALADRDSLERALAGSGVVLSRLSPSQMRRLLGPEQAPFLEPGAGRGWWCRRGVFRLVQLPSTDDGSTASIPSDVPTD